MISFVVAMDENRLIGAAGDLPWRLPNDLAHFKKTTMGAPIVMGRKTYESIGRPLPGRRNIVITRNPTFQAEGIEVLTDFDHVDEWQQSEEEFFVIGGAEIFQQFLPYVERMYITVIHETFKGDTYFPDVLDDWVVVDEQKGIIDEKNVHEHTFLTYERKK
ncbi:dihydrofolate reductase [Texcoconibacillus texcoconensis]|uniref:Dihydrofolate reductase n=1 Tax=Texcoconibacillus texcoconensis TaxID=1095777 RepID=A0A840QQA2_9BACI|nr:dihydrofolate reductase [Texcoconibacillus texcoconensis]MBB5173529.1 dihydrofolate reductase [Texcoconibacillus texcoconensis]